LLMMICATPVLAGKPVQRLNYGIFFKPASPIHLATEYWMHTYEVKLPSIPHIPLISGCHTTNASCTLIRQIQTHLNVIKLQTLSQLNATNNLIMQLIPVSKLPTSVRSKRALLGFVGSFAKTLFGTATTQDVNILAAHINSLTKTEIKAANIFARQAKHLSSFMSLEDTRFNNAMKGIKANHYAIHFASATLAQTVRSLKASVISLTALLIDQIQHASVVSLQIEQLQLGILGLANGKLSPLLIPPKIIKQTIHHLSQVLSSEYQSFTIVQQDPAFYYAQGKFIYARTKTNFYISIKFPLSALPKPLVLYEIISLPVPINETSLHSTQLLDLPSYFAISDDNQHYTTLDVAQLSQCSGDEILYCTYRLALKPITVPSCELALFQNRSSEIKDLCNFRYVTQPKPSDLIEVDQSSVLVYRIPLLSLTCPTSQRMIQGCTFCIIHIPCYCTLSTQELFYPAPFSSCNNRSTHLTRLHPVNLALLQHFFEASALATSDIYQSNNSRCSQF